MKPILFNTEMARAILDGRKTVTRRVMKGYPLEHLELDTDGSIIGVYDQFEGNVFPIAYYAPYRLGDILYVRETWKRNPYDYDKFWYRADGCYGPDMPWLPSIHMPKEAARLFLRVKDVRVERLQDITPDGCVAEGVEMETMMVGGEFAKGVFSGIWDSTIKPAGRAIYSWAANPWVWVIEFERITKEEADNGT